MLRELYNIQKNTVVHHCSTEYREMNTHKIDELYKLPLYITFKIKLVIPFLSVIICHCIYSYCISDRYDRQTVLLTVFIVGIQ